MNPKDYIIASNPLIPSSIFAILIFYFFTITDFDLFGVIVLKTKICLLEKLGGGGGGGGVALPIIRGGGGGGKF